MRGMKLLGSGLAMFSALFSANRASAIDESPLPLKPVVVFKDLQWKGWSEADESGKQAPFRAMLITHAGDGSNRLFVVQQQGSIHVFPNRQDVQESKIFLDISQRVTYKDHENEEGLLGLCFHPQYKTNGEFFVFYVTASQPHTTVVSRFKVSKSDPDQADPKSEEELLRVEHPYWNHKGGTICFGPDGYLYIAIGDGGSAFDPQKNGQNPNSLLAKILRIDVNRKDKGLAYGIPKDNPMLEGKAKNKGRPEIWAGGLRNVWRMSFDRKTGTLWAADVGQDKLEEIDIIVKGGNYGWSLWEGTRPISDDAQAFKGKVVPPIIEYNHDVGNSVTGGHVYRGKRLPELEGYYLYADFVRGRIWALKYDEKAKKVLENRDIPSRISQIPSFGEDEAGEVYVLTIANDGHCIHRFERTDEK